MKEEIIKRLKLTIEKLKTLSSAQFYYSCYVNEAEVVNGHLCATMACVAGWYPKWFPFLGLVFYQVLPSGGHYSITHCTEGKSVKEILSEYHGLDESLISCLFYGNRFYPIDDVSDNMDNVTVNEVIRRFEDMITLIEEGIVIDDFMFEPKVYEKQN